jgi:hypothetical protein
MEQQKNTYYLSAFHTYLAAHSMTVAVEKHIGEVMDLVQIPLLKNNEQLEWLCKEGMRDGIVHVVRVNEDALEEGEDVSLEMTDSLEEIILDLSSLLFGGLKSPAMLATVYCKVSGIMIRCIVDYVIRVYPGYVYDKHQNVLSK